MKSTRTLILTALLLAPLAALDAADAPKPNVIVILADDLGWADLSCYGSTFHESPRACFESSRETADDSRRELLRQPPQRIRVGDCGHVS